MGKSEEKNGGFLKTKRGVGAATQREGSEEWEHVKENGLRWGEKHKKNACPVREMQNRGRRFYHLAHLY